MSTAFAIGAVSAVLKNLLDNAVVNESIASSAGNVHVSVIAPDLVKAAASNKTRLNLFLYHVEPNTAWRNMGMPSRDADGRRLTNAPLALDLFYLLTAYAEADFVAEILLGYAAQLLHEVPILTRDSIRKTFSGILNPPLDNIAKSELSEQLEQIKITPHVMNSEESSKLWSALQTNYRPSIAYRVSVVLIEAKQPARSPMPVLDRNIHVIPQVLPPYPTLTLAKPPNEQPSIQLNEILTLEGHDLFGTNVKVIFESARLAAPLELTPVAADIKPDSIKVTIPNLPAAWPAGNYAVSVRMMKFGQTRTSNSVPLSIAPQMNIVANAIEGTANRDGMTGKVTVTLLNLKPEVRPLQNAALIIGDREAQANAHAVQTNTLSFEYPKEIAPDAGKHYLRLRIDGVESRL
ncbi:MAG: DUF4255 domain-containing protein, partial [Thermoanaerobaculia bacterium]